MKHFLLKRLLTSTHAHSYRNHQDLIGAFSVMTAGLKCEASVGKQKETRAAGEATVRPSEWEICSFVTSVVRQSVFRDTQ